MISNNSTDAYIKQILDALSNNDNNGLANLFSQRALSEIEIFDEQANSLMEFFSGDVDSTEKTGLITSENKEDGKN